jgi:hypothetical protein
MGPISDPYTFPMVATDVISDWQPNPALLEVGKDMLFTEGHGCQGRFGGLLAPPHPPLVVPDGVRTSPVVVTQFSESGGYVSARTSKRESSLPLRTEDHQCIRCGPYSAGEPPSPIL